jgi:hypothetical protein
MSQARPRSLLLQKLVCHDEVLIIVTEEVLVILLLVLVIPQLIHCVCKDKVLGYNETSCTSILYILRFLLSQEARVASYVLF